MASQTRKAMLRSFQSAKKNIMYAATDLCEVGTTYDEVAPDIAAHIAECITVLEALSVIMEEIYGDLSIL